MGRKARAFTLIELLVVIAVIAILAAILFPVFIDAKRNAQKATCVSNLQSIGRALAMYRDNNNGRNCSIWQMKALYGQGAGSWHYALMPYIGQRIERGNGGKGNAAKMSVFKCPAAPWLVMENDMSAGTSSRTGFAYAMNETGWWDANHSFLCPACTDGASMVGVLDCKFRRPRETIIIGDAMGVPNTCGIGYVSNGSPANNQEGRWDDSGTKNPAPNEFIPLSDGNIDSFGGSRSMIYNIRVSHSGKANLLFYDGHVEGRSTTTGRNWSIYY